MNYADWKKVYIDRSLTLKDWQNLRPRVGVFGGQATQSIKPAAELSKIQQIIKNAEDAAYKTKTGSDFGFNKMDKPSDWKSAIEAANADGKGKGRAMNCQRCVIAAEARIRGFDVVARMSWGISDPMRKAEEWIKVFKYSPSDIKKCTGQTYGEMLKSVEEQIRSFGNGGRAVIWFYWEATPKIGHVIMAQCRENGEVVFADPQKPLSTATDTLKMAKLDNIGVMRIDNLAFSDLVKRCCVNRE